MLQNKVSTHLYSKDTFIPEYNALYSYRIYYDSLDYTFYKTV